MLSRHSSVTSCNGHVAWMSRHIEVTCAWSVSQNSDVKQVLHCGYVTQLLCNTDVTALVCHADVTSHGCYTISAPAPILR